MAKLMQYVVPFVGGYLDGQKIIWRGDVVCFDDIAYRTEYRQDLVKIPIRYVLLVKNGIKHIKAEDIIKENPSHTPLGLDIPHSIFELELSRRLKIISQLQSFVNSAVTKYVAGQKEHGGKLEDRACFQEMHNEILDLVWYWYAEKERRDSGKQILNPDGLNQKKSWKDDL